MHPVDWKMHRMKIADIVIGERTRKDLGDLRSLARSILQQGLLEPIGVTDDRRLVFGLRRLIACRDLLGWLDIPAQTVNVTSIAEGEFAENEIRKSFTPSERVALAALIRDQIGNSLHRTTRAPDGTFVTAGGERDRDTESLDAIVAQRAGFGSRMTLHRAQKVIAHAIPSVIDAMDRGDLSINAASGIALLAPCDQQDALDSGNAVSVANTHVRESRRERKEAINARDREKYHEVREERAAKHMSGAKLEYSPGIRRLKRQPLTAIFDSALGMVQSAALTFDEFKDEESDIPDEVLVRWISTLRSAVPAIRHFLTRCEHQHAKGVVSA